MIILLAAVVLALFGLYGVAVKRNLVKVVIGLMVMQYSVDLLLIGLAPEREWFSQLAALAGLSTTILLVAIVKRGKTLDAARLNRLKG